MKFARHLKDLAATPAALEDALQVWHADDVDLDAIRAQAPRQAAATTLRTYRLRVDSVAMALERVFGMGIRK